MGNTFSIFLQKQKNIAKECFVKKKYFETKKDKLSKKQPDQTLVDASTIPDSLKNQGVFDAEEFKTLATWWEKQGWISEADKKLIFDTLADQDAQKLLELWSLVLPVSLTVNYFRDSATATMGVMTQNIWKTIGTYLGSFVLISSLQSLFATYYLRGRPSQKIVAPMYFIPVLGSFAPLGYLTKAHNRFLHFLWAYLHSQDVYRQTKKLPQNPLQQHINQHFLAKNFRQGLQRITPFLAFTKAIWKAVDTIIKPQKNQKT